MMTKEVMSLTYKYMLFIVGLGIVCVLAAHSVASEMESRCFKVIMIGGGEVTVSAQVPKDARVYIDSRKGEYSLSWKKWLFGNRIKVGAVHFEEIKCE